MKLYDSTVDYITQNLGHSFGLGLRIWHDGTAAVTATFSYVITVTSTRIKLKTSHPAAEFTLLFADYPTLRELAAAISNRTGGANAGWEAVVAYERYTELSSSYLAATVVTQEAVATGNTGYGYRKVLCLDMFCETLSGNGESRLFFSMPIAMISSVIEDGTVLTEGATDGFWAKRSLGVLIRGGSTGSQFSKYATSCWSVRAPNNVTLVYLPTWFTVRPAAITSAIQGLMILAMSTSGYQSEKIGDYSYVKDGKSALMWLMTLDSYTAPLSIF